MTIQDVVMIASVMKPVISPRYCKFDFGYNPSPFGKWRSKHETWNDVSIISIE